jgi:DNA mismatch repair protein MutS
VSDIERLSSKIAMGRAHARDLLALKRSLQTFPDLQEQIRQFDSPQLQPDHHPRILDPIAALIEQSIRKDAPPVLTEGGLIKNGFNAELDELLQISHDGKGWLARLETTERQNTGINSLKVKYNKVFGYFIEVSKTAASAVPEHYVRKQTLVNAERYITEELKSFESRVLGAEERRASLEYELFNQVRQEILQHHAELTAMARYTARLDCLLNLAEIADQYDYCRPQLNTDGSLYIEEGRHPVVETMTAEEQYIPNTIQMDDEQHQMLIITGPNMAGKSTVLRQVALTVLMTQIGAFVPARRASVCLTDRIFTRVGALDNLSQGQSTFMVEMEETANIMNNATSRSLIVMDEIGRGTSTFDGLSIAWAVAEFLHDLEGKGVKTLFATHYHELTELAQTRSRVRNFNIAVKEQNDRIIFLRKLVEGGTNRSYGIQVAQLAGIPKDVIQRAKEILADIEHYQKNGHFKHHRFLADQNELQEETRRTALFETPDRSLSVAGTPHGLNHSANMNDNNLIVRLNEIDISTITPLEALNLLNELKQEAQTIL